MNYLNALKTFVRLTETGSFSRVGRDFEIKTSTVSRHIADLEADLGIALFNRTTRGMTLTEGGRTFYKHVTEILEKLEGAKEEAVALNRVPRGEIRVSASPAFLNCYILPHLAKFRQTNPEITVNLISTLKTPNLITEQLDLAILTGVLDDSCLMARKLIRHRYVACTGSQFSSVKNVCDLFSQSLLLNNSVTNAGWFVTDNQGEVLDRFSFNKNSMKFNDDHSILQSCLIDPTLTCLLPEWLVDTYLTDKCLYRLLPDAYFKNHHQDEFVWAVYAHKKTVSSKVRAFIDFLLSVTSEV